MSAWQSMESAPTDGTPVLVSLAPKQVEGRDWMHGTMQVAANRGHGWVSIPGMWSCAPVAWMHLPEPPHQPYR